MKKRALYSDYDDDPDDCPELQIKTKCDSLIRAMKQPWKAMDQAGIPGCRSNRERSSFRGASKLALCQLDVGRHLSSFLLYLLNLNTFGVPGLSLSMVLHTISREPPAIEVPPLKQDDTGDPAYESDHELYWAYGEWAGGWRFNFGKHSGKQINEVPYTYLRYCQANCPNRWEFQNAVEKYINGLVAEVDKCYGDFLVPFGDTHKGKCIKQCFDKRWLIWLLEKTDQEFQDTYDIFFMAIRRFLENARVGGVWVDIGDPMALISDEDEDDLMYYDDYYEDGISYEDATWDEIAGDETDDQSQATFTSADDNSENEEETEFIGRNDELFWAPKSVNACGPDENGYSGSRPPHKQIHFVVMRKTRSLLRTSDETYSTHLRSRKLVGWSRLQAEFRLHLRVKRGRKALQESSGECFYDAITASSDVLFRDSMSPAQPYPEYGLSSSDEELGRAVLPQNDEDEGFPLPDTQRKYTPKNLFPSISTPTRSGSQKQIRQTSLNLVISPVKKRQAAEMHGSDSEDRFERKLTNVGLGA
ncbi:hypothetical protein CVT25_002707 [Psilocybe cyanescens]|uniref:Uncharacterized protein n=1 Tax=Psilocybe cyanescens TaxID=93625 RepID=A0A409WLR1_PSICY|nr:hypothetical protein CVT25_002707 [Psilocybe cyanescens]